MRTLTLALLLLAGCTQTPAELHRYISPPSCMCPLDSGGPRASGVVIAGSAIEVLLTAPVLAGTVDRRGGSLVLSTRDPAAEGNAWQVVSLAGAAPASYGQPPMDSIHLDLDSPPQPGALLRLIVHGSGPAPVLGMDGIAFAGEEGGYPTATGADYVWQGMAQ